METANLNIPQSQLIELLKTLPRKKLIDIFSELIVSYDVTPISESEKLSIKEAMNEYDKGELVNWEDIK